jgi:hypothetical protein
MDQNSTNGSGPDKRNWRERLGVGTKDLPKLSDEFRDEPQQEPDQAAVEKPVSRVAQPVTKPAPMAPRAPAKQASPASAAPPPRATAARLPENATQEALAEKLRAQRAAAERLAEQRVQAARQRAEGKSAAEPEAPAVSQRPSAPPPRAPAAPPSASRARAPVPPPPAGARPKFSFADEPRPERPSVETPRPGLSAGAAPLSPPRPALGGDRGQPPFLRPAAPPLGARPQSGYRPVDPNAGYASAPPRLQPPGPARGGYGAEAPPPAYPGARGAARRPPALEAYPRDSAEGSLDEARPVPRLGRPAAPSARGRGPVDDYDEVFEDDGASRQRTTARDYQAAYRDGEDAFGEDNRRSSGPWLLLLALLAAALVTGGVVLYYNKNGGDIAGSGEGSGSVPVVNAPEDPSKVAPDAPADGGGQAAGRRKLIYDRIVGEQEVPGNGEIQPTLEVPADPAAASQPADSVPEVEPAAGANQIPAPDAADQGTAVEGLPSVEEPPPLPLPPPDSGEQGSLGNRNTDQLAAVMTQPQTGSAAEPSPAAARSSTSNASLLPPPDQATDGAAGVSGGSNTASGAAATAEPAAAALTDPDTPTPPIPKKKPAAPRKKSAPEDGGTLGAEPVVLVPPAQPVVDGTRTASSSPIAEADPAPAPAPAPERKRSIMDLFRGGSDSAGQAAEPETRVAAAPVEPLPTPAKPARQASPQPQQQQDAAGGGSGYLIQLSSFRSEAEARTEYSRLSSLLPGVVGALPQRINQTSVGGSTRYQLGLGPLPSRSQATQVCSELFAAGEADCIVRGL